jgi:hypothetical protein
MAKSVLDTIRLLGKKHATYNGKKKGDIEFFVWICCSSENGVFIGCL